MNPPNHITDEQLADVFKALSNPYRLKIYREVLAHQRHDVGPDEDSGCVIYDLINKMDIGAPTVSHHVKQLVKVGLISVVRNGKFLSCHLNEAMSQQISHFFTR